VFALDVNPFAVPGVRSSYSFSNDVLYQIKIDNTGNAEEDLVIQRVSKAMNRSVIRGVPRLPVAVRHRAGPARPRKTGAVNDELRGAP